MPSDDWEKLEAIFIAALERQPDERPAFLRQASGGDAALQAEAESLLRSNETQSSLLGSPVQGAETARRILRDLSTLLPQADSEWAGAGETTGDAAHVGPHHQLLPG